MNKSLNKIKDGILVGIGIILVLGIANAWTNLGTVNTGDGLTATIWNDVIAKINDIGTRTQSIYNGVGYTGVSNKLSTVVTGGTTGEYKTVAIFNTDSTAKDDNPFIQVGGSATTGEGGWLAYSRNLGEIQLGHHQVGPFLVGKTNGNVGIGTTSPTEKLEVNGNVKMGYEVVSNDCVGTAYASCTVTCPVGKLPTGGGCIVDNSTRYVHRTYPTSNGWSCHSQLNLENAGSVLRAYAICANIR